MFRRTLSTLLIATGLAAWVAPEHLLAEGAVPYPTVPCNNFVPAPTEGIQAWDPDQDPNFRRHTDGVVCVRIIQDGQPVVGAPINIRRPGTRRPTYGQSTALDGVASFIFLMNGGTVHVDVTGIYKGRPIATSVDVAR